MFVLTHILFNTLFWILATRVLADTDTDQGTTFYDGAYMVELKDGEGWDLSKFQARLAEPHKCILKEREVFNSFFFVGGSFSIRCEAHGNPDDDIAGDIISSLRGMDSLVKVWHMDLPLPNGQFHEDASDADPEVEPEPDTPPLPLPTAAELPIASGIPIASGGLPLPSGVAQMRRVRRKTKTRQPWDKRQNTVMPPAPAPRSLTTHISTGVDKLHAEGFRGEGIRIAIVDGDFNVRELAALSKTKITHTYSVLDGSPNVESIPYGCPDGNHGTKVLGVVGGNSDNLADKPLGFVGVAPEASFELISLARCGEGMPNDKTVAGFLHAANRGVDIITASLGGIRNYPDHPVPYIISRIMSKGIFVAAAIGNTGKSEGVWDVSSTAGSRDISAVGSTDNLKLPYFTLPASLSDGTTVRYAPNRVFELSGKPLTIWFPADAEPLREGCNPLPANVAMPTDPENTILLIDLQHCWTDPESGLRITKKLGIRGAIFYVPSYLTSTNFKFIDFIEDPRDGLQQSVTITFKDVRGLLMKMYKAKRKGRPLTITFNADSINDIVFDEEQNRKSGELMSSLSSWGPTLDGRQGPMIAAPGGQIITTSPKAVRGNLGWEIARGTSMSCPFYAGVVALLKQKFQSQGRTPTNLEIQTALTLTAKPLKWWDATKSGDKFNFLAPVYQQGAGFLDAWEASNTRTMISSTGLNFNDTENRPRSLTFTLSHRFSEPTKYKFSHQGAASGYILKDDKEHKAVGDVHDVHAEVQITPAEVTIAPGDSAEITVSITKDPNLPDFAFRGVYFGGYIAIAGPEELLSLPYSGFGSALIDLPMVNGEITKLIGANSKHWVGWDEDETFHCYYDRAERHPLTCQQGLRPGVLLKTTIPSAKYVFYIVDVQSSGVMVQLDRKYHAGSPWPEFKKWFWDGTDEDKTFLPPGSYVFQVRVLKMYGDPRVLADYEVWQSPVWNLRYVDGSTIPDELEFSQESDSSWNSVDPPIPFNTI